jgi:hypothetical protein
MENEFNRNRGHACDSQEWFFKILGDPAYKHAWEERKEITMNEAQKDLSPIGPGYEFSTGCWIDSRWGHYGSARLVQIAIDLGWDDPDAGYFAERYFDNSYEMSADESEQVYAASEDAELWLNEVIAKPGYLFGWSDGEFFLMPYEWWTEEE